jgi:hypothetical protein
LLFYSCDFSVVNFLNVTYTFVEITKIARVSYS